ncbi:hypothetical protein CCUS01_06098 [Colletotrichum cuscutae]|uniref:Uncharacterized protein n=1 Tax=Colletotrichum cuscutae TaxID=1209917 RepID=A0AAI9V5N4_9PEZI|nr:hypothetical protein CCUS01_06098 [Colletotrichum cuscutae]
MKASDSNTGDGAYTCKITGQNTIYSTSGQNLQLGSQTHCQLTAKPIHCFAGRNFATNHARGRAQRPLHAATSIMDFLALISRPYVQQTTFLEYIKLPEWLDDGRVRGLPYIKGVGRFQKASVEAGGQPTSILNVFAGFPRSNSTAAYIPLVNLERDLHLATLDWLRSGGRKNLPSPQCSVCKEIGEALLIQKMRPPSIRREIRTFNTNRGAKSLIRFYTVSWKFPPFDDIILETKFKELQGRTFKQLMEPLDPDSELNILEGRPSPPLGVRSAFSIAARERSGSLNTMSYFSGGEFAPKVNEVYGWKDEPYGLNGILASELTSYGVVSDKKTGSIN